MASVSEWLADERATEAFGAFLGSQLTAGNIVYLHGDLGAGKTTLVRGLLRSLGYTGPVKSPTYTLIETYEFKALSVHHLDIYRLAEPEELEWLGVRDLFSNRSIALIEWPEKGDGFLPGADVRVMLSEDRGGRRVAVKTQDSR